MPSRLGLLMQEFHVTGKALAEHINIDTSMVSKWRSGKRIIKPKSAYTEKLVSYFIELDRPSSFSNIIRVLKNDYESIEDASKKKLEMLLKAWLTCGDAAGRVYSNLECLKDDQMVDVSIFYKFSGNKGRRQAVDFFVEYANKIVPYVERFSYTEEGGRWFYEDIEYLHEWQEKNIAFLRQGNKISIIHPIDRAYETTALSMFSWLPLHMTGNTYAYYIPRSLADTIRFTIFLIPGHLAFFSLSSHIDEKGSELYLTNDSDFLESMENIFEDFLARSKSIFSYHYYDDHVAFMNDLLGALEANTMKYMYCSTFMFVPLSKALLVEILAYNDIAGEEIEHMIEKYNIISNLSIRSGISYIVNLDRIKTELSQKNIVLDSFSFVFGKTIAIPIDMYIKMVEEVMDNCLHIDMFQMAITDSNMLYGLSDINIFAQENSYVFFSCSDLEKPLALATKELTVAISIYLTLGKIWDSIPVLKKNKDFVREQILEILALEKSGSAGKQKSNSSVSVLLSEEQTEDK